MQKNNTNSNTSTEKMERATVYDAVALCTGCVFLFLPGIFTENATLYIASPVIYLSCFLFYTRRIRKKNRWPWFFLAFALANQIRYFDLLGSFTPYSRLLSVGCIVFLAMILIIPFQLDNLYGRIVTGFPSVFAFPLFRVAEEILLAKTGLGQEFNLSLTQFDNKWLLQTASVFGEYFVSFITALVPSVLVYLILLLAKRKSGGCKTPEYRRNVIGGAVLFGVCILTICAGGVRYVNGSHTETYKDDPGIYMAYASGPKKIYYTYPAETDPEFAENKEYLSRTIEEAAAAGAKLIAYGEEAYDISSFEREEMIELACKKAKENNIYVLLSLDSDTNGGLPYVNEAILISNEGEFLSEYRKTELIPFIETTEYVAGDGKIPCRKICIDGNDIVLSFSICYDATFSQYLRTMDAGTNLYINPSWDWEEIEDINYRLQGFRAVENGIVFFKPTSDGYSTVVDPYGNVLYKNDNCSDTYEYVFYTYVPFENIDTFYEKHGGIMEYLWGVLLFILGAGLIPQIKKQKTKSE